MSSVPLHYMWRDIGDKIGFYTNDRFDDIPRSPGLYAWYYPLQFNLGLKNIQEVTKESLKDALCKYTDQVNMVMDYVASVKDIPKVKLKGSLSWQNVISTVKLKSKKLELEKEELTSMVEYIKKGNNLQDINNIFMQATIFMPPLYVGKTRDLHIRCRQHLRPSSGDSFCNRFTSYVKKLGMVGGPVLVENLLFVCIETKKEDDRNEKYSGHLESLIEKILQLICKPGYSAR